MKKLIKSLGSKVIAEMHSVRVWSLLGYALLRLANDHYGLGISDHSLDVVGGLVGVTIAGKSYRDTKKTE